MDTFKPTCTKKYALQQHKEITSRLTDVKKDMPWHIKEHFDTHFQGIYGLIRQHRNEAGHPTGTQKSRDEVLPLFHLFIIQAGLISGLIQWLGEEKRF